MVKLEQGHDSTLGIDVLYEAARSAARSVPELYREDAIQEAMIKLVQKRVDSKAHAYVIAKNTAIDYIRHEKLRTTNHYEYEDHLGKVDLNSYFTVQVQRMEDSQWERKEERARELYANMKGTARRAIEKRLRGETLTRYETVALYRWRRRNGISVRNKEVAA